MGLSTRSRLIKLKKNTPQKMFLYIFYYHRHVSLNIRLQNGCNDYSSKLC